MACDKYLELLSARLDGALSAEEERELEEHLAVCPDCRAAGAQLSALQGAFPELEEVEAPEGFVQGVMDRIGTEKPKKVIPLFKRPQVRAVAGLAACLVLVVGIYGISQLRNQEKMLLVTRSFQHDVMWEEIADGAEDVSACESLGGDEDAPMVDAVRAAPEEPEAAQNAEPSPEPAAAPPMSSYAMPGDAQTDGVDPAASEKQETPEPGAAMYSNGEDYGPGYLDRGYTEVILTLDRMPEGGWELIPPDTPVSPDGMTVSAELMEQLEQLAQEQGITVSRTSGPEASGHCLIVILDEEN